MTPVLPASAPQERLQGLLASASTTAEGAIARTVGAPAYASITARGATARTAGAPASFSITEWVRTAGAPASASITASGANARSAGAPVYASISARLEESSVEQSTVTQGSNQEGEVAQCQCQNPYIATKIHISSIQISLVNGRGPIPRCSSPSSRLSALSKAYMYRGIFCIFYMSWDLRSGRADSAQISEDDGAMSSPPRPVKPPVVTSPG
jgi:hypothetical protein